MEKKTGTLSRRILSMMLATLMVMGIFVSAGMLTVAADSNSLCGNEISTGYNSSIESDNGTIQYRQTKDPHNWTDTLFKGVEHTGGDNFDITLQVTGDKITPAPVKTVNVLVLDYSTSMNYNISGSSDKSGGNDSRLQLMKDAAKEFIDGMTENDFLAIVTYNKNTTLRQKFIQLNNTNKTTAKATLDQTRDAATNIQSGLIAAYQLMYNPLKDGNYASASQAALKAALEDSNTLYNVILMSDGAANYSTSSNPTYSSTSYTSGGSSDNSNATSRAIAAGTAVKGMTVNSGVSGSSTSNVKKTASPTVYSIGIGNAQSTNSSLKLDDATLLSIASSSGHYFSSTQGFTPSEIFAQVQSGILASICEAEIIDTITANFELTGTAADNYGIKRYRGINGTFAPANEEGTLTITHNPDGTITVKWAGLANIGENASVKLVIPVQAKESAKCDGTSGHKIVDTNTEATLTYTNAANKGLNRRSDRFAKPTVHIPKRTTTYTIQYWKDQVGTSESDTNYLGKSDPIRGTVGEIIDSLTSDQLNAKKDSLGSLKDHYSDGVWTLPISEDGSKKLVLTLNPETNVINVLYVYDPDLGGLTLDKGKQETVVADNSKKVTYTLTVTNPNPEMATVNLTDDMFGLAEGNTLAEKFIFSSGITNFSVTGNVATFTIARNGIETIKYTVTHTNNNTDTLDNPNGAVDEEFTNTANIKWDFPGFDGKNGSSEDEHTTVTVPPMPANVVVEKVQVVGESTVTSGETVVFKVTVTNTGKTKTEVSLLDKWADTVGAAISFNVDSADSNLENRVLPDGILTGEEFYIYPGEVITVTYSTVADNSYTTSKETDLALIETMKGVLAGLETEVEELKAELALLEPGLTEASTAVDTALTAYNAAKVAFESADAAYDGGLSGLEGEKDAIRTDIDSAMAYLQTAVVDLQTAQADLQTATIDLDTARVELQSAQADLQSWLMTTPIIITPAEMGVDEETGEEYEIAPAIDNSAEIDATIAALESQIGALEATIATLESQIGSLNSQIDGLNSQILTLETTISGLENDLHGLANQQDDTAADYDTAKATVEAEELAYNNAVAAYKSLEDDYNDIVDEIDAKVDEIAAQVELINGKVNGLNTGANNEDITVLTNTITATWTQVETSGSTTTGGEEQVKQIVEVETTVTPRETSNIVVTKKVDGEKVVVLENGIGREVTYTVTVTNIGNTPVEGITLVDEFGKIGETPTSETIEDLLNVTLLPGASETITYTATIDGNTSYVTTDYYKNTITASYTITVDDEQVVIDDSSDAIVVVKPKESVNIISVEKTSDVENTVSVNEDGETVIGGKEVTLDIESGEAEVTYTIKATTSGRLTDAQIGILNDLVTDKWANEDCEIGLPEADFQRTGNDTVYEWTYSVTFTESGTYKNAVILDKSNDPDNNEGVTSTGDEDDETIVVNPKPVIDLSVTKKVAQYNGGEYDSHTFVSTSGENENPLTIDDGTQALFAITITNKGNTDAKVYIEDTFDGTPITLETGEGENTVTVPAGSSVVVYYLSGTLEGSTSESTAFENIVSISGKGIIDGEEVEITDEGDPEGKTDEAEVNIPTIGTYMVTVRYFDTNGRKLLDDAIYVEGLLNGANYDANSLFLQSIGLYNYVRTENGLIRGEINKANVTIDLIYVYNPPEETTTTTEPTTPEGTTPEDTTPDPTTTPYYPQEDDTDEPQTISFEPVTYTMSDRNEPSEEETASETASETVSETATETVTETATEATTAPNEPEEEEEEEDIEDDEIALSDAPELDATPSAETEAKKVMAEMLEDIEDDNIPTDGIPDLPKTGGLSGILTALAGLGLFGAGSVLNKKKKDDDNQ